MKHRSVRPIGIATIIVALVVVAGAAAASSKRSAKAQTEAVSGTVTFDGIWTGAEQKDFQAVIAAFNRRFPHVKVKYRPLGNNLTTVLSTAITGGHPPDMADIAQPGFVKQLVAQDRLKPITYARKSISRNFAKSWLDIGTFNRKLYALVFKASNKSLLWYNVPAFKQAGVKAPKTWTGLLADAKTLKASGIPPYSIGGSDGWTLTDLFENIYLRTYGPTIYNDLAAHKIKWTNPTVIHALERMRDVIGNSSDMYGGTSGALQFGFNDSVTNAFSSPPKAAMVFEADFVSGVILSSTKAKPITGFNVVPFPTIRQKSAGTKAVEISGDLFVTFRDNPAIRAFVNFLATPAAADAWARRGGFATGNHNVSLKEFPNKIDRANQEAVRTAKSVVFDMSDEQPAAFGSTVGQGEWGIFQTFLKNPSNVKGVAQQLEKSAAAAYKKAKK